jgi:hypothetical protein
MNYSVAFTSGTNEALKAHLLRADGQEDLCYALWHPGQGANSMTALNLRTNHTNWGRAPCTWEC